jgi:DNA-binding SARP family transcriptional activator/DNA-binding CsgD family transcriptional regulator
VPDAQTRIDLCGRLSVCWEGTQVEGKLRGRQGRLLFAYLVLHRHRPVRRDELLAAVWPDTHVAPGALAPLLSRLRRIVGDALVGRSDLTLVLPAAAAVDVEDAKAAVALGRPREAVEILRAGLLPGLEAPWIEEARAELELVRVEALELAGRAALAARDPAAAAAHAREAIDLAPFRESARLLLIEALRAQGNVAEALRAYEDIRVLLREEVGSSPGPELVALYEALLEAPAGAVASVAARGGAIADLVERERELAELDALLAEARAGTGRVAVVEGPAGVGKTRLLAEARRRAAAEHFLVLGARAGQFERDHPFGAVRQLFEAELQDPERRARLLGGAAAPAAAAFGDADLGGDDASFAVLHGLFWLTLNVAAERPLVLALDDLHWCDKPSLRFFAYLSRRLDGVAVLVAATVRSGEPPTDEVLLGDVLHDAAPVRPGPLSPGAVRVVVRSRLGAQAEEAFCAACHETTGGNPLLLRQLLTALAADRVEPTRVGAAAVRETGSRAIARTIGLRLAQMEQQTVAVARAVAVLGEHAELPLVARLAELDEHAVAAAVAELARAEIVRTEPPLGFVHPLVHEAVYRELGAGERALAHGRAARLLADAGAADDTVAVHLRAVARRGDRWVAGTLVRAARLSRRRGAAETAVDLLRRALEEPPPADERPELLLELGRLEAAVDGPASAQHLEEALDGLGDPAAGAAATVGLAWACYFLGRPDEVMRLARTARFPPELGDLRQALRAIELLTALVFPADDAAADQAAALRRDPPAPDGPGALMLLASTAFVSAMTGAPSDECQRLARLALADGRLFEHDDGLMLVAATSVLVMADQDDVLQHWAVATAIAHKRGSLFLLLTVHLWRGWALLERGELAEAEALLLQGEIELREWSQASSAMGHLYSTAFTCKLRLERDDIAGARELALAFSPAVGSGSDSDRIALQAKAEVLLADGQPSEALRLARTCVDRSARLANPGWIPARSLVARSLAALGDAAEAERWSREHLAAARSWGAPGTLGRALRELGEITGDVATLQEAVAVLEASAQRLERAKAWLALGRATRNVELLGRALDLAEGCDAERTVREAQEALTALGAQRRAPASLGPAALTDLERRVAALASEGRDARAIAEALYLTPHEAQEHLGGARRKLRADSAHELQRALAA